jgi:hypothetical protein
MSSLFENISTFGRLDIAAKDDVKEYERTCAARPWLKT